MVNGLIQYFTYVESVRVDLKEQNGTMSHYQYNEWLKKVEIVTGGVKFVFACIPLFTPRLSEFGLIWAIHNISTLPFSHHKYSEWFCKSKAYSIMAEFYCRYWHQNRRTLLIASAHCSLASVAAINQPVYTIGPYHLP
eukprot:scaffold17740_cov76-Cyclotella_meneghiniana.AAC.1